jgi:hypothetical protein
MSATLSTFIAALFLGPVIVGSLIMVFMYMGAYIFDLAESRFAA